MQIKDDHFAKALTEHAIEYTVQSMIIDYTLANVVELAIELFISSRDNVIAIASLLFLNPLTHLFLDYKISIYM